MNRLHRRELQSESHGRPHRAAARITFWPAAIARVVVAFAFLPNILKAGISTMSEFSEYRFSGSVRAFMAFATIFIYLLLLGAVTYSGALTLSTLAGSAGHEVSMVSASLTIGVIAMLYVTVGGLKACAWADSIQGSGSSPVCPPDPVGAHRDRSKTPC